MRYSENQGGTSVRAFTLIELLVVIAIISTLAALIFPVSGAMKKKAMKARARAELVQVETAIEGYKAKLGFYPPDNPGDPIINPLYFELLGTTRLDTGDYQTLDGSGQITVAGLATLGVAGFVNSSASGAGDDSPVAIPFVSGLKPGQVGELSGVKLLVCSVQWPDRHDYQPVPAKPGLNPWRYVSSHPTNNASSYDLWIDIMIGGRTNRISNWSRQPQVL